MSNREKVLIKICHDVLNSYENPESPNFIFVGKRINEGMYDEFLNAVETQYIVSDLSDLNYSSCLDWSITSRRDEKNRYGVSLSLVGRYAVAQRYKSGHYLSHQSPDISIEDLPLITLFQQHNIILLDGFVLNSKLPVKIEDEDFTEETQSCVYNLLFERL